MSTAPDPQALVDALRGPSHRYKRAAVDAVIAHRDATLPLLLDLLRAIRDEPGRWLHGDIAPWEPLYAVALVTHLRAPEAHDLLLELARLDESDFELIFGDYLTQDYDLALFNTAHGRSDGLRALVNDRAASGYLRSQAADALVLQVVAGEAERAAVVDFLDGCLAPDAAEPGDYFWTAIGHALLDLCPIEHADRLRDALREGLIEEDAFGEPEIEATLDLGVDVALRLVRDRRLVRACSDDPHIWLSGYFAPVPTATTRGLSADRQKRALRKKQAVKRKQRRAQRKKARKRK